MNEERSNEDRRESARSMIAAYDAVDRSDFFTSIQDAISDLLHLAHEIDADEMDGLYRRSWWHYTAELAEEAALRSACHTPTP